MSSNQPQPAAPQPEWHWDHPGQSGPASGPAAGSAFGPAPYGQFGTQLPEAKPGRWARFRHWAFSNLNLNGRTPPRVQPVIGEWGPAKVPTTKQKKRMRIYVGIALPAAMLLCFLLGWYVYFLMTGCYGFGFGCRS